MAFETGSYSVTQAGLKLSLPASKQVLGLQVWVTTPGHIVFLKTKQTQSFLFLQKVPLDMCLTMFIVALFVIARTWNNLNAPQPKNG